MAETKLDFRELEAMRKDDCSWRPCCISLSSGDPNVGIRVDFENGDEDLLSNKEDVLSRLRFRSTPLQGDECTNIKEGDRVLALQKAQSKCLFIDATIEQAKRVKHSKRVHCRCAFEVKWLNSELKGEIVIVPSMSILRFSDRSIDEHPIFSSFVKALSSKNGGESPSILSFTEESSCEAEFVGILEKQVEEISKLVDGPITSFTNIFIDAKSADIIKQKPSTAFVQSKSPKIRQSSSKRTTRSQSNNQIETEVRKETELKPVLSPLAARAALASLVHELPEKSCYFSGGEDFLKLKDSQQSDGTGVTELSALEATSNSVKSTCNHQIRELLPTSPSKIKNDCTRIEVTNPPITSSKRRISEEKINTHGSLNLSEKKEKEMEAEYKPIIPQNSRNLENGEKTKIPTSMRITRSQRIKPEVTFLGAEPANSRYSVIDRGSFSKSRSFQLVELSSDDDDDDMEGSLSKKSPGLTIGTGRRIPTKQRKKCSSNIGMSTETGNKADELGSYEVKDKKFISTHVDSTSETDSTAQRNELATKRRRRVPSEFNMGSDAKNEEKNQQTAKKNCVSSKRALKTTPMRSSPRLACPPRTRSQTSL